MNDRAHLPVDDVTSAIVEELRANRRVVVEAPPGAGKSTRVPPALLDARLTDKQVVLLEPRRVAARAIASRIAEERGSRLGDEVGWQIRWEKRGSSQTRLWVITEGILTRRVLADPFLDDIGVLILDEFHERSVHTDLALGFAKELLDVREDLHLVVMSATLDAAALADFLGCRCVRSEGRMFPVEPTWLDAPVEDLPRSVARAVRQVVSDPSDEGDILVFLPGLREIDDCRAACRGIEGLELHRLHGRLPDAEQDAALRPGKQRKVIFATNIAETSLTIPKVTAVIDSGLVRIARADVSSGFDRLETAETSLASARQRAGRAGRVAPGRVVHLWTQASEFRRREFDEPEVERIDLSAAVLDIVRWSGAPPEQFAWYETPPSARLTSAMNTLEAIGAIEDGSVTAVGEQLSEMPLHPRIARFLVEADALGIGPLAANVAASLSEQDWVTAVSKDIGGALSDTLVRAQLLDEVAAGRTSAATAAGLQVNVSAARRTARVASDLRRWTGTKRASEPNIEDVGRALIAAFPDRIAFRAEGRRYALSTGGSVVIGYESLLESPDIIVATSVFGTTRVDGVECAIVRQGTALERPWLPPDRFTQRVEVRFDPTLDRLTARRVSRFDTLVLAESTASLRDADASAEDLARAIANQVARDPVRAYALEKDSLRFLQRVDFVRRWMPDLDLPDPRDEEFLLQLVWGSSSFADLRRKGFVDSYRRCLGGPQLSGLDEHAPDRYPLRGRQFRIDYSDPEQPVLAARIQDFFGQTTTPTLADGRVVLTLHLLAPNQRPQQVTQDLESFWMNTYAEVRKELRARYPKHDWPADPFE